MRESLVISRKRKKIIKTIRAQKCVFETMRNLLVLTAVTQTSRDAKLLLQ